MCMQTYEHKHTFLAKSPLLIQNQLLTDFRVKWGRPVKINMFSDPCWKTSSFQPLLDSYKTCSGPSVQNYGFPVLERVLSNTLDTSLATGLHIYSYSHTTIFKYKEQKRVGKVKQLLHNKAHTVTSWTMKRLGELWRSTQKVLNIIPHSEEF